MKSTKGKFKMSPQAQGVSDAPQRAQSLADVLNSEFEGFYQNVFAESHPEESDKKVLKAAFLAGVRQGSSHLMNSFAKPWVDTSQAECATAITDAKNV